MSASRNVYGSGAAYVTDFNAVLGVLQQAAAITPDTLTASVLRSTTQSQTDQLVAALAALQDEVTQLRQEVAQGSAMPARLVA